MASHHTLGKKGETIAAEFLRSKGYHILHANWKYGRKEIDIIARLGETLVFVEVKTRSGQLFGMPEDAVNRVKEGHLRKAAENYLERLCPETAELRFDIVSITLTTNKPMEIMHFEDVF
ncbi:YraN family protein [Chitinophaga sp. GCM10012297]|uniref:UPF0102 protein J7I43_19050 n=1 Tax=Chitinophaga chungangae TaxID=2821488 RepID=A0ABS3YI19_9BACT|nr:YraN family protein [Chitinophaga chungangae]MBO9154331.1 YraN family protein [Chitinophaga chungangae]